MREGAAGEMKTEQDSPNALRKPEAEKDGVNRSGFATQQRGHVVRCRRIESVERGFLDKAHLIPRAAHRENLRQAAHVNVLTQLGHLG